MARLKTRPLFATVYLCRRGTDLAPDGMFSDFYNEADASGKKDYRLAQDGMRIGLDVLAMARAGDTEACALLGKLGIALNAGAQSAPAGVPGRCPTCLMTHDLCECPKE